MRMIVVVVVWGMMMMIRNAGGPKSGLIKTFMQSHGGASYEGTRQGRLYTTKWKAKAYQTHGK